MTDTANTNNNYNKYADDIENNRTTTNQKQTVLNLYYSGIPPDIISLQLNMSQEQVNQIIQSVNIEERHIS